MEVRNWWHAQLPATYPNSSWSLNLLTFSLGRPFATKLLLFPLGLKVICEPEIEIFFLCSTFLQEEFFECWEESIIPLPSHVEKKKSITTIQAAEQEGGEDQRASSPIIWGSVSHLWESMAGASRAMQCHCAACVVYILMMNLASSFCFCNSANVWCFSLCTSSSIPQTNGETVMPGNLIDHCWKNGQLEEHLGHQCTTRIGLGP